MGPQSGQPTGQRATEWFGQIPASTLLGGQYRAPWWARVAAQRPARDTRIGARAHSARRCGQMGGAPRAPTDTGEPATGTFHGQHQIQ